MKSETFDKKLACECAQAFSTSTGLGCTVSDKEGTILAEYGYGCESCKMCSAVQFPREKCVNAHIYGMWEAERFGGQYIYFCPMGLTCFVSPILGDKGSAAKITAGPFIMVEKQDFTDCELTENFHLSGEALEKARQILEDVPFISPEKVNSLSMLLFMSVGFMNNVSAENRLLHAERSEKIQGQITSYILELKGENAAPEYPFETEEALLRSISRGDKETAQRLLNELLGAILFAEGGNLELIKSRIYELLVLISRVTAENGTDRSRILAQNRQNFVTIQKFQSLDAMCVWLSDVINQFMENAFSFLDAKHANIIHRCVQHIGSQYGSHITLESTAAMVYLSPPYLSRIFKQETGVTFNQYLNQVRIGKAQELLRHPELSLAEISQLVGYEDQSYFTKVFKRITGENPRSFREKLKT